MIRNITHLILLVSVGLLMSRLDPAHAAGISGDITTRTRQLQGGGGTNAFFAHSEQFRPMASGPNQICTLFTTPGLPAAFPPSPGVAIVVGGSTYSPTCGINNLPKPVAPVVSVTGDSTSGNIVFGQGTYNRPMNTISAFGFSSPGVVGRAAGAAFDPFDIGPGPLTIDYQYTINASLLLDGVGDVGGVTYFAVDSRFSGSPTLVDLFYERGQPLAEALWSLSISTNGVPTSVGDLNISFHINPGAIDDNILFLNLDSDPSTNELNENLIESRVIGAFSFPGGTPRLTLSDLFPAGTTYTVRSQDGVVHYGVGVNAGVTDVTAIPEPTTFTLSGTALFILLGWMVRKKRCVSKTSGAVLHQNLELDSD